MPLTVPQTTKGRDATRGRTRESVNSLVPFTVQTAPLSLSAHLIICSHFPLCAYTHGVWPLLAGCYMTAADATAMVVVSCQGLYACPAAEQLVPCVALRVKLERYIRVRMKSKRSETKFNLSSSNMNLSLSRGGGCSNVLLSCFCTNGMLCRCGPPWTQRYNYRRYNRGNE